MQNNKMSDDFIFKYDPEFRSNKVNVTEILYESINYLLNFSDSHKLVEDYRGYNGFIFIGKFVGYYLEITDTHTLVSKGIVQVIAKQMQALFDIRNEIDFEIQSFIVNAEKANTLNEKRILVLSSLLYTTNVLQIVSVEFVNQFVQTNGLKVYLEFLKDEHFLISNLKTEIDFLSGQNQNFFQYLTLNLYNLSRFSDEYKQIWSDLDAVNILLKAVNLNPSIIFNSYRSIANIADDKHIESLKEIHSIIEIVIKYLKDCKCDFDANQFVRRKYQIHFKGNSLDCFYHSIYTDNSILLGIKGLLDTLYKLSINDKVKHDIYFSDGMQSCFSTFLLKGKH